jgi:hypothetical protein
MVPALAVNEAMIMGKKKRSSRPPRQRKTPTKGKPPEMSSKEEERLDEFEKRCTAVRDLVHHVVTNEDTYGFYLWGPRGCGKTTGIERALEELGVTPVLFRGTMTAQSLYVEAKGASDGTLWINDDPGVLTEPAAQQYLLAMLEDSTDPKTGESHRLVTRSRVKVEDSDRFIFKGKILFDSNLPIVNSKSRRTLEAVEDRLVVHHFGPTDAELGAVLRYLAQLTGDESERSYIRLKQRDLKYWEKTTTEERSMIVEFIIDQAVKYKVGLSLRSLRDTLKYYVGQKEHGYSTDWRDMVVKELTRYDVEYRYSKPPSRKDQRLEREREELTILLEDFEDLLDAGYEVYKHNVIDQWCERTSQNERQFRRRLAELPDSLQAVYDRLLDRRARRP